jgi:hypothetical protein
MEDDDLSLLRVSPLIHVDFVKVQKKLSCTILKPLSPISGVSPRDFYSGCHWVLLLPIRNRVFQRSWMTDKELPDPGQ